MSDTQDTPPGDSPDAPAPGPVTPDPTPVDANLATIADLRAKLATAQADLVASQSALEDVKAAYDAQAIVGQQTDEELAAVRSALETARNTIRVPKDEEELKAAIYAAPREHLPYLYRLGPQISFWVNHRWETGA